MFRPPVRAFGFLVAVALFALLSASTASASDQSGPDTTVPLHRDDFPDPPGNSVEGQADSEIEHEGADFARFSARGLGGYGPEGTIQRSDLPPGLSKYVAAEALELAQSRTLAQARSEWNRSIDFVDQVDYQLSFRQHYDFLSATPEAVAVAMRTKSQNEYFDELQLLLTAEEARELRRRDNLGDKADRLRQALNTKSEPSNVVDLVQDQLNGGQMVAYVLNEEPQVVELANRIAGTGNLKIVEVPYTAEQYRGFQKELSNRIAALGLSDYELGMEHGETITISLQVSEDEPLPADLLDGLPGDAVELVVVPGSVVSDAGMPIADHPENQYLTAGVRVRAVRPAGTEHYCTWGLAGHTNSYHYIVTAGHCFTPGSQVAGWRTNYNVRSSDSVSLYTQGSNYIYSTDIGTSIDRTIDAARITSTNIAATNCMHQDNNSCAWAMEALAQNNSWETGTDRTCASLGNSNAYRCGYIDKEGVESGGHVNLVRVKVKSKGGDSGSGFKWNETIDGLLIRNGQIGIINKTDVSYFQMAEDVRSGLGPGFDFNCYSYGLRSASTSTWLSSCPVVNR